MSSPSYASSSGTGTKVYRKADLQATKQAVKTSRARVYGYAFNNPNAADAFVHLYDAVADNVTVGTSTPLVSFIVKATSQDKITFTPPIEFNTAVTVAATTTLTGSTDPTAGLLAQVFYV